jgi:hypothetical protein
VEDPRIEVRRGAIQFETGDLGTAWRPQWVQGKALVRVQGVEPQEAHEF